MSAGRTPEGTSARPCLRDGGDRPISDSYFPIRSTLQRITLDRVGPPPAARSIFLKFSASSHQPGSDSTREVSKTYQSAVSGFHVQQHGAADVRELENIFLSQGESFRECDR